MNHSGNLIESSCLDSMVDKFLPRIIEKVAQDSGAALAIKWKSSTLTYGELNKRANQYAHCLAKMGAGPDVLVGLCLDRGIEMIVALLAIQKTGAAYLPLDSDYPTNRLREIIDNAEPLIMITDTVLAERIYLEDTPILCPQRDSKNINQASTKNLESIIHPNNPCYVVFTSGSTGEPKGVTVTYGNVADLFSDIGHRLSANTTDVWSQIHSLAFGFSVFEIWGAFTHGACLSIAPIEARTDSHALKSYLKEHNVTMLSLTPSAFRLTALSSSFEGAWPALSIRAIILSGEEVKTNDLQRWSELASESIPRLINTYAITEAGGNVMWREYKAGEHDASNIGKPLNHLEVHLLDEYNEPVTQGESGELYVCGSSIAAGYINDTELTENRFIYLPAFENRMYRTGDIIKALDDNSFEFVGRRDNQVKWHGFRLELGEIETLLGSHPGIKAAAVVIRQENIGVDKLIAYVQLHKGSSSSHRKNYWSSQSETSIYENLRNWLLKSLPRPLIPNRWMIIDEFPLNTNGKLDRNSLPELLTTGSGTKQNGDSPQSTIEKDIADIWNSVLGITDIGIRDNFFDIGGDSIAAVHVTTKLQELIDADVEITAIFEYPTITELACFLEDNFKQEVSDHYSDKEGLKRTVFNAESAKDINNKHMNIPTISQILKQSEDSSTTDNNENINIDKLLATQRSYMGAWKGSKERADSFIYTLNKSGDKHPLFWIFQGGMEHAIVAANLGPDQPLHGMRSGYFLIKSNHPHFKVLAQEYAIEINQLQPSGELYIGGNCQGGLLAREVALCLLEMGRRVERLLLMEINKFDSYPENVTLLFGRQSHFNPYQIADDPDADFKVLYPGGYSVSIIEGSHGSFFSEANITSLIEAINDQLRPVEIKHL